MEELLTTEPGPPKGAKPVNGIAKTIAPPAGAKKKEDTVSEPSLNDGSTQAGLDVSQEPGPKGAKPSGKSTEDNEYTRYFNAYQEKLGKQYSDKLSKELEPYDQELAAKPDLTNQSAVDEYNRKVNERNAFAEKRSKEIDQEFQTAVTSEFDRVKNQVEGFNKANTEFLTRQQARQGAVDLSNRERNPFVTAWTTASSTLTKDLPSSFYGTKSILGSIANKIDTKIEEGIQGTAKALRGENYNPENVGQSIFEKTQKIGRQEVVDNFKKAIDLSDLGAEQKANLTNSLEKVKDGDFVDYLNYIGSAVGQGIGQIPASIGTRGATSLVQEIGSIYIDSVKKIAEEESQKTGKEVTYEDVIMQGKDEVVWPMITGMAAGLLDAYGANKLNPFGKKEVLDSFRKRALALGKVVGTETVTEGTQGALENIGASKRDDQTWEDVFKEFNWGNVAESALQGGIASLFLGGAGQGITKALDSTKQNQIEINPIKVDTGKLSKRYQPIQPLKSQPEVIKEARTSIPSADNTQKVEEAAEKVIATTQNPNATEGQQLTTQTDGQERNGQGRQEVLTPETTVESPQQSVPDITTVGENYVKRDNKWYVKDAEGIERPLISENPNKTQEEQNTELAQLKELKAQLETETPVKVDLSPTGKSRIAEMEAFSPEGRVRKWLFGGGQLLWNSKSQGEGKPTLRGLKDETGYSNKEQQDIKQYVHDTNGISVEQAAEQLAAQYQDRSPQEYRNAIIEVFSSDPKKWYEQQVRDEDPDYAMQEEQRFQEAGQLNEQIKQLETQEEGVRETNQQLYENERRVNYGSPAAEGQAAGGQVASPGSGSQTQVQPRESIRKNGDANKSKQALEELKSKNLTHVPGLGMGQIRRKERMYLQKKKVAAMQDEERLLR